MTVKELMERTGTTNFGFVKAYIEDGIREINTMVDESVATAKTGMVKDQRYYGMEDNSLPGLVKVLDISILDEDSGDYKKIPRVQNVPSVDKDSV